MPVGVLIISHDGIGRALLESASVALGGCPLQCRVLSASRDADPDRLLEEAQGCLRALDSGQGVLVLTDLYGSTPSNIATRLAGAGTVRIVAGVNLPMLIRVLNYPALGLEDLVGKAVSGGRDGIFTPGVAGATTS